MLRDNQASIERKSEAAFEVVRVGIKDASKERILDANIFTTDLDSIVNDPDVDIVIELMGGVEPAARLVETALRNGKNVITANKELIAKEGSRLVTLAKSHGLDLHYEAAVGGGIPIVQPLKHQLAGNDVLKMMGILNGTTNYVLTQMHQQGADFADALSAAQAHGYAEADPTNDIDGFDTMYKISILASIAFGRQVPIDAVYREGISGVSREDMAYADLLGYRIKLLGIVDAADPEELRVRVHPTLILKTHPLAQVDDVYNALWLHGDFVGDLMFSGRGAGSDPTASAVVGDLIDVARNISASGPGSAIPYGAEAQTASMENLRTAYYFRLRVDDRPKVLGQISTALGNDEVSLSAMEMRALADGEGEIVFLTHPCREADYMRALHVIESLPSVRRVASSIRVEA